MKDEAELRSIEKLADRVKGRATAEDVRDLADCVKRLCGLLEPESATTATAGDAGAPAGAGTTGGAASPPA